MDGWVGGWVDGEEVSYLPSQIGHGFGLGMKTKHLSSLEGFFIIKIVQKFYLLTHPRFKKCTKE
jgi:hypothetical protein